MTKEKIFRFLEWIFLVAFLSYLALLIGNVIATLRKTSFSGLFYVLAVSIPLLGYCVADLVSGFVHFLADNFGSVDTFFFGPKFIMPFREHHIYPKKMTEHSFVHVSGNTCLVSLFVLVPVYYFVSFSATRFSLLASVFTIFFISAIFLTNQIHAWAHADKTPKIVRWLQRKKIILAPDHHQLHHTSPHDTYYCITTGWFNSFLERIGFFEKITALIRGKKTSP